MIMMPQSTIYSLQMIIRSIQLLPTDAKIYEDETDQLLKRPQSTKMLKDAQR